MVNKLNFLKGESCEVLSHEQTCSNVALSRIMDTDASEELHWIYIEVGRV